MMSLTRQDLTTGIVIKKIPYKDYHEIIHILTDQGHIESFFYENVNKSRNKLKVAVPCEVSISYFKTSGMNKIITLDIDNYYHNIVQDVVVNSYVCNMLEQISYSDDITTNYYKIVKYIVDNTNDENIDIISANCYFMVHFLSLQGFRFRYQKTDRQYEGYSFTNNMFVDYVEYDKTFYKLDNRLVKLIYILSQKDAPILEQIFLEEDDNKKLFNFLNVLLREYLGMETKSSRKILELEEMLNSFGRENNND